MDIRGWVYVIDNEAMPGLLKIGYSTKDPALRARELAGTGSPLPFNVVYDVLVENPRSAEQSAHSILKSSHVSKEWFKCSLSEAISAINASTKNVLIERKIPQSDCTASPYFVPHGQSKAKLSSAFVSSSGLMPAVRCVRKYAERNGLLEKRTIKCDSTLEDFFGKKEISIHELSDVVRTKIPFSRQSYELFEQ